MHILFILLLFLKSLISGKTQNCSRFSLQSYVETVWGSTCKPVSTNTSITKQLSEVEMRVEAKLLMEDFFSNTNTKVC